MTLSLQHVTFDCANAAELAAFWSAALGRPVDPNPQPFYATIGKEIPDGQLVLMFIAVPEPKSTKNRVHLDLHSDDPAGDVARLIELGATLVHEKNEWNMHWFTLADIEGNEFCVG
jgi:hypothetical protein